MTTKYMMDVTTEAVRAVLEKYGVHGHIHRPGIYDECIYNKMALRRDPEYCQFIDLLKNNE